MFVITLRYTQMECYIIHYKTYHGSEILKSSEPTYTYVPIAIFVSWLLRFLDAQINIHNAFTTCSYCIISCSYNESNLFLPSPR